MLSRPNRSLTPPAARWRWLYLIPPILVPLLVFLPRITGGGFSGDDWSNRSAMMSTTFSGIFDPLLDDPIGHRSLHLPYVYLYDAVFTSHPSLYLLWAVLTAGAFGALFALLLARLRVPLWAASSIGTLGAIYPYASMTKLWATAHVGHITGILALLGILLALRGLRRRGRIARIAHHAGALVLFLLSLNLYEIALPIVCAGGLCYLATIAQRDRPDHRAGVGALLRAYRPGLLRWAADLAVVGAWYASLGETDIARDTQLSLRERVLEILSDGAQNIAGTFVPFLGRNSRDGVETIYSGAWFVPSITAVVVTGVIVFAAACVLMPLIAGRAVEPERRRALLRIRNWGLGILAAIVAAYAGWLAIVPADPYYRPVPYDAPVLRVNVIAAFGLSAIFVAVIGAVAELLRLLTPRRSRAVAAGFVVLALLAITVAYNRQNQAEITLWNTATSEQVEILDAVDEAFDGRDPAPDTNIFLTDSRGWVADGAEVFHTIWSFRGALRATYDDPTLIGVAFRDGAQFQCRPEGLATFGLGYEPNAGDSPLAPYGRTALVSFHQARRWDVRDMASCRRAVRDAGLTLLPRNADTPPLGTS
ncbi:MAG: hypothetical protein WC558_10350 [Patulibacter sp.]